MVINYINELILNCKFRRVQINSISLDIYWSNLSTQGYSGTLGNYFSYARNLSIDEVSGALGMISNKLFGQEASDFYPIADDVPDDKKNDPAINQFVHRLGSALSSNISCILDVGAHFKGFEDKDICKVIYEILNSEMVSVTFFNKDSSMEMFTKDGNIKFADVDRFSAYLQKNSHQKILVYHPQTACTGVDIIYPPKARGLILVYPQLRGIDFKQAALRLRNLGTSQSLQYGIAKKLKDEYAAWNATNSLPESCFLFLKMLENEVEVSLSQSESVAFSKIGVEARCLVFDYLCKILEENKGAEINFDSLFSNTSPSSLKSLWESLFFKHISLDFSSQLVYEKRNVSEIISEFKDEVSQKIQNLHVKGMESEKKVHLDYLSNLIEYDLRSANISREILLPQKQDFDRLQPDSQQQMLAEEENLSLMRETVIAQREQLAQLKFQEGISPFRELREDTSSLKAFVKALEYNSRPLEEYLKIFMPPLTKKLPQFSSKQPKIHMSYYFWRLTREFSQLSKFSPEKVNSAVFVLSQNKRLQFYLLSSLQIDSLINRAPDIIDGYALISPLGHLIHSPYPSLEAFLSSVAKGNLKKKKELDKQLDFALFQMIFFNQMGISLSSLCESKSVLNFPRMFRFIEWISMPGTPPGIFFDLLKERSIYCMRSEIETSQLATLMQTENSKFCSLIRTAASELESLGNYLTAAMEILMEDADSWLLFASFQHFHPRKVNVPNSIAYDTMRIIVNFFNDPTLKAEFKIDLLNLKKILDYIKTYHFFFPLLKIMILILKSFQPKTWKCSFQVCLMQLLEDFHYFPL